MNIPEAIIARILQDKSVTLTQLEQLAHKRAVSLSELYTALEKVSRDKRIKQGVRKGEVYYEPAPPKKTPVDHLKWVRENYPDTSDITATGMPIPFYDPKYDGPSPVYGMEHTLFVKKKNEELKRKVEGDSRVYNKKRYG